MALDPIVTREKSRIDRQKKRCNRKQERVFYSQPELQFHMQQLLATPSKGKAIGNWYHGASQNYPIAALAAVGFMGSTLALMSDGDDADGGDTIDSWLPDFLPSAEAGITLEKKELVTQADRENATEGIADEFNNQPHWMQKLIKQKYDGTDPRPISVKLEKPEVRALFKRLGMIGHHGLYSPEHDTLVIPVSKDPVAQQNGLDAVDHEIFHALWDHFKIAEEVRHPTFKGPSFNDITDYIAQRSKSASFQPIREYIQKAGLMLDVKAQYSILANNCLPLHQGARKKLEQSATLYKASEEILTKLPNNEAAKLKQEYQRFVERFNDYNVGIKTFLTEFSDTFGKLQGDSDDADVGIETLEYLTTELKKMPEQFEKYEGLTKEIKAFKKKLSERITYQKDLDHQELVKDLNNRIAKSKNEEEITHLKEYLSIMQSTRSIMNSSQLSQMEDLLDSFSRFGGTMKQINDRMTEQNNRQVLHNSFYDPNEFMARESDSLLGLYFGPTNPHNWELSRESLEFWKQFSVKPNALGFQRMLKDAIQKYEVGLYMKEQGSTPEEIRKELEFSKGGWHRYKGSSGLTGLRYHRWRGPEIKFEESLPYYDGHDKLLEGMKGIEPKPPK